MNKGEVMDRLDIAPPGDRDVRFQLCDFVRSGSHVTRHSGLTLDEISYTVNGWVEEERDDALLGVIVGERYVKTGRYVPDRSTPSTPLSPAEFDPPQFKLWRTHHVFLVARRIRQEPIYVLSDRLEEI